MAVTKVLAAAALAGLLVAGASSAGAQSLFQQNNQNNQNNQHPAPAKPTPTPTPARPLFVAPRSVAPSVTPPGNTAHVTPGAGSHPLFGTPPVTRYSQQSVGAGARLPQGTGTSGTGTTAQYGRGVGPRSTAHFAPGATTGNGGNAHPLVTNRWPGQGSTASLLHPYGTVPGWHGGADARLFHPGAGTGGHPGTTFAAGATGAGAAGFHAGVAPHWHEFMRGSAPAFDAA